MEPAQDEAETVDVGGLGRAWGMGRVGCPFLLCFWVQMGFGEPLCDSPVGRICEQESLESKDSEADGRETPPQDAPPTQVQWQPRILTLLSFEVPTCPGRGAVPTFQDPSGSVARGLGSHTICPGLNCVPQVQMWKPSPPM